MTRKPTSQQERGAALVEFAVVSVLLMFLIYAIAAFGILLSTKNSMTHAAAEGARAAVSVPAIDPSNPASLEDRQKAQAKATVAKALGFLGAKYDAAYTVADIADCSATDTHDCITVTITYPWSAKPLIPQAPGLGLAMPNNLRATAVVRLS